MYSLYFITLQRSGTRPVAKPLRSIRPEHRGTFHTQFWLGTIYIYIYMWSIPQRWIAPGGTTSKERTETTWNHRLLSWVDLIYIRQGIVLSQTTGNIHISSTKCIFKIFQVWLSMETNSAVSFDRMNLRGSHYLKGFVHKQSKQPLW